MFNQAPAALALFLCTWACPKAQVLLRGRYAALVEVFCQIVISYLSTWHCCRNRGIATALGILVRPSAAYMNGLWQCWVTVEISLGPG